jgi:hypothetical protein
MAKDDSASVITLHQPKRPKTGAERARAYRERKKGGALPTFGCFAANHQLPVPTEHVAGARTMLTPVTAFAAETVTLVTSRP